MDRTEIDNAFNYMKQVGVITDFRYDAPTDYYRVVKDRHYWGKQIERLELDIRCNEIESMRTKVALIENIEERLKTLDDKPKGLYYRVMGKLEKLN